MYLVTVTSLTGISVRPKILDQVHFVRAVNPAFFILLQPASKQIVSGCQFSKLQPYSLLLRDISFNYR